MLNPKKHRKVDDPVDCFEVQQAIFCLVRILQLSVFAGDLKKLIRKKKVGKHSSLLPLSLFFDNEGIIRVGGRLANADIPFDEHHPIILPPSHAFTTLLIRHEHARLLHAGAEIVLAAIRSQFWIISGRNSIKKIVCYCVPSYKVSARAAAQLMGQLPVPRVNPSFAFDHTGTDFAGPFSVRKTGVRSGTCFEAYARTFICRQTKAIHLEAATSLTTEDFIAALYRFVSRRGRPTTLYSDNGTNFIGANNKLSRYCIDERITWKFISPGAPHMGGL